MSMALSCSSTSIPSEATMTFPEVAFATVTSDAGALRVELRTAPEQPPSRGGNTFQLRVVDASTGLPQDGLLIEAVPWMAAHAHGAALLPAVMAEGDGVYVVRDVELFMPGLWELRLTFSGARTDRATSSFDVP
jgi:hypothetical protein